MNKYTVLTSVEITEINKKRPAGSQLVAVPRTGTNGEFITLYFKSSDPTEHQLAVRNIFPGKFPDGTSNWGSYGSGQGMLNACFGKQLREGVRHTGIPVEPYEVNGVAATTYSMVVFSNEDFDTIFARSGHTHRGAVATVPAIKVEAPAGADDLNP